MTVIELQKIVEDERNTLNDIAATRPMTNELMRQYETLRQQLVSHERDLCLAKQMPVAMPLKEWVLKWTQYHDKVHLSSTETRVTMMCEVYQSSPTMFLPLTVSFSGCVASKLVVIDYDEIEDHSMFHSGLEGLGAYSVENSAWKREVTRGIDSADYVHYLFCFSSCVVEAVARGLDVSLGKARRGTSPGDVPPTQ